MWSKCEEKVHPSNYFKYEVKNVQFLKLPLFLYSFKLSYSSELISFIAMDFWFVLFYFVESLHDGRLQWSSGRYP